MKCPKCGVEMVKRVDKSYKCPICGKEEGNSDLNKYLNAP